MNGSAKMGTPELYHLEEKVFNEGTGLYYYTTYEIMLTLLDRNSYQQLWKKCYDGNEESLALLGRVGVKVIVYDGSKKHEYKIRDFCEAANYRNYLEAAKDLNAIRVEGDRMEIARCLRKKSLLRSLYAGTLGEKIYEDIMNFIRDRINDAFKVDFEITESKYDNDQHIEQITAKFKDYILTVDFYFKSADIDLDGQYLGNKIANVGFNCYKESYKNCIKSFRTPEYNYKKSLEVLEEYLKGVTYLSEDVVGPKLIAPLNQRVYDDTQAYLKDHSHLTKYVYKNYSKDAGRSVTKVEIIANWKTSKLDSLIKDYNESFVKKMPLGKFLREKGLVSELNLLVEKDQHKIVQLKVEDDNDPNMIEVIKSIRLTKDFYTKFRVELAHYFDITFADRVIDLPGSISKMLDDLKATPFQKKLFADEIRKLNDYSTAPEDSDDDDFDDLPNYSCDSGPGGYSPYD